MDSLFLLRNPDSDQQHLLADKKKRSDIYILK